MGEVYRARDARLDREVAIKVLPASYSADPDRLRRFEQEARAAGRLNHPNVMAIYDIGTHEGAPYVVVELLEGATLREKLATGAIPTRKAVDFALQIARGLGAAHEKGIVHRDLKPENVFVTNDGRVKILDFGLAKLSRPETSSPMTEAPTETRGTEPGSVFGTVGYMSPEQIRGQNADARSDIFAFGALLYELLSGHRAFRGNSSADVMSAILKDEPAPLVETGRNIPAPLERLVSHCLEKSAEERFQSARDIAYDLEALSGISASTTSAPRGAAGRSPRRLPIVGAIAVAVIAAAAGLIAGRATKAGGSAPPTYHALTFRRGSIGSARFAPDGQSVVYSARWDGAPAQLFLKRPEAGDSIALNLPPAELLSISRSGEMNLALTCMQTHYGVCAGTLAQAPMTGGAPHQIREKVQEADWTPDGTAMLLVRDVAEGAQLEFPPDKILDKTVGHLSFARISPKGDRIAFFDHPARIDDGGTVAMIDLSGRKTTLAGPFSSLQGLAWSPDGSEVWFTAARTLPRELYAVSLSGKLRGVAAVPGNITLRDISKSGRVLVTHDLERASAHAVGPGDSPDRDLSWLNWTLGTDLSEDGKTALLEEEGGEAYEVGLRPTDGSPIARLTLGQARGLSYDGKWALVRPPQKDDVLVPTGPGQAIPLAASSVRRVMTASWFPDGKRILYSGVEPGHASRLYVRELPSGSPRPITPEGFSAPAMTRSVSPDGRFAVAIRDDDGSTWIIPIGEGESRRVEAIEAGRERPIRWTEDGRGIYVRTWKGLPFQIFRVDLASGARVPWKRIAPSDLAGAEDTPMVRLSANGEICLYTFSRKLSTLYVVDGLR